MGRAIIARYNLEWRHDAPFAWIKLGLTAFFWALMFHLGKYAVGHMSLESIGGWRFLIAALVLVPLAGLREGLDWPGLKRMRWPCW